MILSVVFTSFGYHTGWDSSSVFRPMRESICRVGFLSRMDTSVGDVVEFLLVVPMGLELGSLASCQMENEFETLLTSPTLG